MQTKKKDELAKIEREVQKRWETEHTFETNAPKVCTCWALFILSLSLSTLHDLLRILTPISSYRRESPHRKLLLLWLDFFFALLMSFLLFCFLFVHLQLLHFPPPSLPPFLL